MSGPHPLFGFMQELAKPYQPQPQLKASVTLSFDDPKAVAELREELALQIKLALPAEERQRRILAIARKYKGEEADQALTAVLDAKRNAELAAQVAGFSQASRDPQVQARIALEAAKTGVLEPHFKNDPALATRFVNRAEATLRGAPAMKSQATEIRESQ